MLYYKPTIIFNKRITDEKQEWGFDMYTVDNRQGNKPYPLGVTTESDCIFL